VSLIIASITEGPAGNDVSFQTRLIAKDGTGTAVDEEGPAIKIADVSTIDCVVYDLDSESTEPIAHPIITSAAVLDTLTDDDIWQEDTTGRNFLHTVPGNVFQKAHNYLVVYTITLTGGTVFKWGHRHQAVLLAA